MLLAESELLVAESGGGGPGGGPVGGPVGDLPSGVVGPDPGVVAGGGCAVEEEPEVEVPAVPAPDPLSLSLAPGTGGAGLGGPLPLPFLVALFAGTCPGMNMM